ncbi:hypothetical protein KC867_02505 [Candidatus Saccharibacteria bacterium]|nr:hypothetical protein [Candidatus Saccharibacteria bacterium]
MKHTKNKITIKPSKFTEASGWYGLIALLVAYALASLGIIKADGLIYLSLNLTGGIGLLIVAASKNVLQSVILNIFWTIIGMVAIIKLVLF